MRNLIKSLGILAFFPLNWTWNVLLTQRRAFYKYARGQKKMPIPMISVGNISHGGTGKTPLVLWLAKKLERQFKTVIVTRGYKSRFEKKGFIINPQVKVDGSIHGDEASLLAENLERTHIVLGQKRSQNLARFLEFESKDIGILEDGFQHLKIARDLDIVLIDSCIGLEKTVFQPLKYREPFEALGDVDIIVLTNCHLSEERKQNELMKELKYYLRPDGKIYRMGYRISEVLDAQRQTYPLEFLESKKFFAFCGIARPDYFWDSLKSLGAEIVKKHSFKDHHEYREKDIKALKETQSSNDLVFITTEKDFVKIENKMLGCPLFWVKVDLDFYGSEEDFFKNVVRTIKKQSIEMVL